MLNRLGRMILTNDQVSDIFRVSGLLKGVRQKERFAGFGPTTEARKEAMAEFLAKIPSAEEDPQAWGDVVAALAALQRDMPSEIDIHDPRLPLGAVFYTGGVAKPQDSALIPPLTFDRMINASGDLRRQYLHSAILSVKGARSTILGVDIRHVGAAFLAPKETDYLARPYYRRLQAKRTHQS